MRKGGASRPGLPGVRMPLPRDQVVPARRQYRERNDNRTPLLRPSRRYT